MRYSKNKICHNRAHAEEESARESFSTMGAIKIDRGEKAESFGGSSEPRKLSRIANGVCGELLFPPWYPSAMDKVSSHFARSPFAHPRAVFFSSSRLFPLLFIYPSSDELRSRLKSLFRLPPLSLIAACLSLSLSRFPPFSLNFLRCFPRRTRT